MEKSKVKSNFIYQLVYQIFVLAIPFIMSPYVSRVLGPEGLGTYSYSYSIAYYFVLLMMLGLLNYGNRTIAKCRDNKDILNSEFSSILILHILLSIIVLFIYIGYILWLEDGRQYALIQITYVISGLFDITWFYHGIEKFKMIVARNVIIKIMTFLLTFLFVKNKEDLWIYCTIMSSSTLISQIVLWFKLKKYVCFVLPDTKEVLKHVKPMLLLFIPTIAISFYKYMDKIMIGILSDSIELGYYENAENAIKILTSILGALGTVMLPRMSGLVKEKNYEEFNRYINISIYYLMIVAIAMSFGMAGIAYIFAPVFWGKEFYMSSEIIIILACTVPFISFANVIRTQFLLPKERDKEYIKSVVIGAIINVILNAILIPRYRAVGAAVATVFAEAFVCIVQIIEVRRDLPVTKYIKDIIPFMIIGIVEFMVVCFVPYIFVDANNIICLFIQIIIGITIYCVPALIILYIRKDNYIMGFIQKKKRLK